MSMFFFELVKIGNKLSCPADAEHAADAAAQEVAAGRGGHAAHAGRRRHVARGGLRARLRAPRGGAPHVRGDGETQGQPPTVLSQSTSEGEALGAVPNEA